MTKRTYTSANVTLRFSSTDLDPLGVILSLRLPYDHLHRAGEPRLSRKRDGTVVEHAAYHDNMWAICSEKYVDSPRLETHLNWTLDQIEPRAVDVANLMNAGWDVDLYCCSVGTSSDPPSISRGVRQRSDALQIPIGIDHYDSSQDSIH